MTDQAQSEKILTIQKAQSQMPHTNFNYQSNSLRKLKRLTNDMISNVPSSSRRVETEIQSNRLRLVGQQIINEFKRSDSDKHKLTVYQKFRKEDDMLSKNSKMMEISRSLKNIHYSKNMVFHDELSREMKLNNNKRVLTESFRDQCIIRDKYKHPIKYRIASMEKGINDQQIYQMKGGQYQKIIQEYTKKKGLQYLREGRMNIAPNRLRLKTQPAKHNRRSSLQGIRNYQNSQIHKLFGGAQTKKKPTLIKPPAKKSSKKVSINTKNIKAQYIQQLKQQECILGKIVFQKVKKHLKEDKCTSNYFKRVHNQDVIDDALVKFLKVRIERADAMISK